MRRSVRGLVRGLVFAAVLPMAMVQGSAANGPMELRVDNLKTPLGIDDPAPRFSWQLQDPARGARQTAYEVLVGSSMESLRQGKADVWDSGRVESAQSMNVPYGGPAIAASTRYFWRVKAWDATGKEYPEIEIGWWETGLLIEDAWRAGWIGFETAEEAAVRNAPAKWISNPDAKALAAEKETEQRFACRATVKLDKPLRRAAIYATGQDTVAVWVNGAQVVAADPFPPYKQMPWKKFVLADVTGKMATALTASQFRQCITSKARIGRKRKMLRR